MSEDRRAVSQEMADLREATLLLSQQVGALSLALQVVGTLQTQQISLDKKLNDTQAEAGEQRELAKIMLSTVEEVHDGVSANTRSRQRFYRMYLPVGLIVALCAGAIYVANNQRLSSICEQRNRQARATQQLLELAASKTPAGPYRDQLMLTNAVYAPIDCSQWY